MWKSGKFRQKAPDRQRRPGLGRGLLSAVVLYAMMGVGASALDFKCVEPSRYKNLLQIFEDNPAMLSSYFGLSHAHQPEMNACRALVVSGTIRDGDGAALLDNIIRNKGWLDVLYLSFDGVHLQEEIKLAHIIRGFWLKTRVLLAGPFRYSPDFARLWGLRAVSDSRPSAAATSELSPLNRGLEAFAKRGDLGLPNMGARNVCLESCAGAWIAGVHRQVLPLPAIAVPSPAAAAIPEIVTAWPRSALAASLDGGKIAPPNDPSWNRLVIAGAASVLPPAADRLIRDKCTAELIAGQAIEDRVAGAMDDLARGDFGGVRRVPADLLEQVDSLRMAGLRLQRCVARAFESERLASFRRLCGPSCDNATLLATFDQMAKEFIESRLSLSNILGPGQSDKIGREWREEEAGGPGTWIRRETSNVFDATWTPSSGPPTTATIEIGRVEDRIAMVRSQAEGRCLYRGIIAADDKSARGTYTCSWAPGTYAWNGTISE